MRRTRGGVLVLTLVVLTAVVTIMASLMATQRAEFKAVRNRLERAKARLMAESAVQRALSTLSTQTAGPISKTDEWSTLGNDANELFRVGEGSFRMQVVDAASLVNLNTASEEQLLNLNLTQEQVDGLLDWRTEGNVPRADGAKDEYYTNLPKPYLTRERRMLSLDEVLLIKGFLPSSLYDTPEQTSTTGVEPQPLSLVATVDSYSPNTDANGQTKGNINTVQAQQLVQRGISQQVAAAIVLRRTQAGGQFATLGDVLRTPGIDTRSAGIIVDNFALGNQPRNEGKINVNTATEYVLASVPGITSDVAANIVSRQTSGMTALSELLQVPGFSLQLMQQTIDSFSTTSESFVVRAEGSFGQSRVSLEAVVSINGGRARVMKIYEPPYQDMPLRWGWQDTTTSETVLGENP